MLTKNHIEGHDRTAVNDVRVTPCSPISTKKVHEKYYYRHSFFSIMLIFYIPDVKIGRNTKLSLFSVLKGSNIYSRFSTFFFFKKFPELLKKYICRVGDKYRVGDRLWLHRAVGRKALSPKLQKDPSRVFEVLGPVLSAPLLCVATPDLLPDTEPAFRIHNLSPAQLVGWAVGPTAGDVERRPRWSAVNQLECGDAGSLVFACVVGKHHLRNNRVPVSLVFRDETAQSVLLKRSTRPFPDEW